MIYFGCLLVIPSGRRYNTKKGKTPLRRTCSGNKEAIIVDIQKIISDLVSKLTENKDLIGSFTKDPLKAIKDLLGIDLDPSKLSEVVNGVTSRIGGDVTGIMKDLGSKVEGDLAEATKDGAGILDKIKSIFGK